MSIRNNQTKNIRATWPLFGAVLALLLLTTVGCSEGPREASGRLDTPEHHTLRGNDFLAEDEVEKAGREFDLALSLDKKFAPALAGKAVVTAINSAKPGVEKGKRKDLAGDAEDLVEEAIDEAKTEDQERVAYIAGIRVARLTKHSNNSWLKDASKAYKKALKAEGRRDPRPYFYMAQAYRDAFQLREASDLYRKVLDLNRGLTREADDELALLQRVERSQPGSRHAKAIAFEPSITRADLAALFIAELKLGALYNRNSEGRVDTSFKKPASKTFQADSIQRAAKATDIDDHPMKADIKEVMALGVLGLEPDPSHKFHPDTVTTRAEFAIMVEDILVRVTGEQKLKTKFIGGSSPYADVRSDVPYYNAVQTVVTRSLMQPKNKIRGLFGPMDPVNGADALLVIRQLKTELKSYLRR